MEQAAPQIVTFGCRLNAAESELMQRQAAAAGLQNAIIVNTCAVTAEAERQARQSIRKLRAENPDARIIVTGCAAHIHPDSFAAMPEVDHLIANDRKTVLESFTALRSGQDAPMDAEPLSALDLPQRADTAGAMQRAFIEVQNGCDHRCTFCIIPYGRGVSRSVPMGEVAQRLRAAVAAGYSEVVITGVDIASYGKDLPAQPSLGQMLRRVLAQVPDLPRLRLSSLDPAAVDEDLWGLIASEPRLMPHLHLSLQAGDDLILKRMKRRHLRDDVIALCDRARHLRPDITFGADIITGFPTESDAMFAQTRDLVRQCGLTWLHVFPYSARTGTPAAKMPQVHGTKRKERAEQLRADGMAASAAHHATLVGQAVEVLVEQQGLGCTPHFAKIVLEGHAPVGRLVMAECYTLRDGQAVARVRG
ncbi:MAG: tRNA (N(6)-L-threonylcarbamoyladenosine(37)-C(2))-methylthiotransferase MtaB [Alphaproteobacteria bacterium]|nr:tRNA (N(6)-L-threonylcarbamoyladenosine(37)-C(2))-methylthiotransferase MtaB [Alphaproteobacteria bacterium]